MFSQDRGMVVACDVDSLWEIEKLVEVTESLPFIQGYKIGASLALDYGLRTVAAVVRDYTPKTIIYDHQKFGTDIPDMCRGPVIDVFQRAGVDSVIVFPQAGRNSLEAAVGALIDAGLEPMVGGEMTHSGYLRSEGGYIADESPQEMYLDAARLGVRYYIVPGTRPDSISRYNYLGRLVTRPSFLFPGIGNGQGGDIVEAFLHVDPFLPAYAIIGRGIYTDEDPKGAAERMWQTVVEAGLDKTKDYTNG